jgi:fructokinase
MSSNDLTVFGEVLFDHFPDGKRVLGGAPFNVAWHLQAFGQRPFFISRVGDDDEGREIIAAMRAWGLTTDGVQRDAKRSTGRVGVVFESGEPAYDIVHPCAYDAIEVSSPVDGGWLYHGSLATRDPVSCRALDALTGDDRLTVFVDVNLRDPWWDKSTVLAQLQRADWVKLNQDELRRIGPTGLDDNAAIEALVERYDLDGALVTYGASGAVMLTRQDGFVRAVPQGNTEVVDTVGAGDAFAAVCILGLRLEWPVAQVLERAQSFASRVVAQQGAISTDTELYRPLLAQWGLAE